MSSSLQHFGEGHATRRFPRLACSWSLACILAALIPPSPKLETTRGLFVEEPRLTPEGDLVEVVHHVWRQSCLFFYFRTSLVYALIECLKNSDSNVRKVSVIIPFPLC